MTNENKERQLKGKLHYIGLIKSVLELEGVKVDDGAIYRLADCVLGWVTMGRQWMAEEVDQKMEGHNFDIEYLNKWNEIKSHLK